MLRPWNLKLQVSRDSSQAIYLQIAEKIIDEIQIGRLPPATAMPGTRELAEMLNVNRKTIVLTYDELIAQGWLVSEHRRGTFVSSNLPQSLSEGNKTEPIEIPAKSHSNDLGQNGLNGNIIDFSEGAADSRLVPFEAFSRAFRRALVVTTRANASGMTHPKGKLGLRASISNMLNMERGLHVNAENICMVRGSQMGVFLIARTLAKRSSGAVIFESLSYPGAREAFKSCGMEVLHAGLDHQGIRTAEIERLCLQQRIQAVYVTPQHQFPTTVTMSVERRKELLRLADEYDFTIIEDDRENEIAYANSRAFPLASENSGERIVYIGALNKSLAPGMQIAYVLGSKSFADLFAAEHAVIDYQDNSAMELAVSELMNSGEIRRHIRKLSKIYVERRDYLIETLRDELSPWLDFHVPEGGLAFWMRFKVPLDIDQFALATSRQQVKIGLGGSYAADAVEVNAIRLEFSSLNDRELTSGINRIKRALQSFRMELSAA